MLGAGSVKLNYVTSLRVWRSFVFAPVATGRNCPFCVPYHVTVQRAEAIYGAVKLRTLNSSLVKIIVVLCNLTVTL